MNKTTFKFVASLSISIFVFFLIQYWDKYNLPFEFKRFDIDSFFQILIFFPIGFSLSYFFLQFLSKEIEKKWWKFARVYLPIALILILISGDGGGGLGVGFGGGYDREGMIWFTAGLFTAASLITILRSWWKERKSV